MGVMDEEYFYEAETVLSHSDQVRADKEALRLQQSFITRWVLNYNIDLFKTDQEKDWAYIVRKEMKYIDRKSWGIAFAQSSLLCAFYMALVSRRNWGIPMLAAPFLAYHDYYSRLDQNTRRLFGMLNLGTEFELGAERNRVLEECNRITKRYDF